MTDILYKVYRFYVDGFRSMTEGVCFGLSYSSSSLSSSLCSSSSSFPMCSSRRLGMVTVLDMWHANS